MRDLTVCKQEIPEELDITLQIRRKPTSDKEFLDMRRAGIHSSYIMRDILPDSFPYWRFPGEVARFSVLEKPFPFGMGSYYAVEEILGNDEPKTVLYALTQKGADRFVERRIRKLAGEYAKEYDFGIEDLIEDDKREFEREVSFE